MVLSNMRKIRLNSRLVLLIIIAVAAASGVGWALWGHEYGIVLGATIVLLGSIYAFFKKPLNE
jgi:hypothetical protein